MPFDQIHCADLAGWSGETDHGGWIRTLARIAALIGRGPAPATAIAAAPAGGLMAVLAAEIEGIGVLRLRHRAAIAEALTIFTAAFRANTAARGGTVFRDADDVMMAAFAAPAAAVQSAVQVQGGLAGRNWPGIGLLKVRMAVHYGAVEPRAQDYLGPAINRVARLLALARGEQILVTGAIAEPLAGRQGLSFSPVGAHALEDPLTQVSLFQVGAEGLKADFAPIASEEAPRPGNLPRRQGALIGRAADMTQIATLFATADLVTVTGTPAASARRASPSRTPTSNRTRMRTGSGWSNWRRSPTRNR